MLLWCLQAWPQQSSLCSSRLGDCFWADCAGTGAQGVMAQAAESHRPGGRSTGLAGWYTACALFACKQACSMLKQVPGTERAKRVNAKKTASRVGTGGLLDATAKPSERGTQGLMIDTDQQQLNPAGWLTS